MPRSHACKLVVLLIQGAFIQHASRADPVLGSEFTDRVLASLGAHRAEWWGEEQVSLIGRGELEQKKGLLKLIALKFYHEFVKCTIFLPYNFFFGIFSNIIVYILTAADIDTVGRLYNGTKAMHIQ